MTLVSWEYIITLADEVDLFWSYKPRLCLPNILFVLNRFWTLGTIALYLANNVSTDETYTFCSVYVRHIVLNASAVQVALVDFILALRIWGMYSNSRTILILLVGLGTVCGFSAIFLANWLHWITGVFTFEDPISLVATCELNPVQGRSPLWFIWIPVITFEAYVFILAAIRFITHFRRDYNKQSFGYRLINILMRDSLVYFIVLMICYLANILIWEYGPGQFFSLPLGPTFALSSIIASKMLMNLRMEGKAHKDRSIITTDLNVFPLSNIQFASLALPQEQLSI